MNLIDKSLQRRELRQPWEDEEGGYIPGAIIPPSTPLPNDGTKLTGIPYKPDGGYDTIIKPKEKTSEQTGIPYKPDGDSIPPNGAIEQKKEIDKETEEYLFNDKIFNEKVKRQDEKVQSAYKYEIRRLIQNRYYHRNDSPDMWDPLRIKLERLEVTNIHFGMKINDIYTKLMEDRDHPWRTVNTYLAVVPVPPNEEDPEILRKYYYETVLDALAYIRWYDEIGRGHVRWQAYEDYEMLKDRKGRSSLVRDPYIGAKISAYDAGRVISNLSTKIIHRLGMINQVLDHFLDRLDDFASNPDNTPSMSQIMFIALTAFIGFVVVEGLKALK
jgi:hypothetical protein